MVTCVTWHEGIHNEAFVSGLMPQIRTTSNTKKGRGEVKHERDCDLDFLS